MANFIFPFTNMHELNLDWVVQIIKQLETELTQFVALNTIKYANPFQWNITTQYAQNTLVLDPQDGTAYLSVQPVPQGVQITDKDYWTPVFTLQNFTDSLKTAITDNVPQQEDGQAATQTIPAGSVFFVGDRLCYNQNEIPNTSLVVVGSNCVQLSIMDIINYILQQIAAEQAAREGADNELESKIAAEQAAREEADTQLQQSITAEQTAREEADTQLGKDIAEQKVNITDVKTAGAVGDGVTDDTAAIQAALDNGGCVYFPKGTFKITGPLYPKSNTKMFGCGTITLDNQESSSSLYAVRIMGDTSNTLENITIDGLTFTCVNPGNGASRNGITIGQNQGISSRVCNNITVSNCRITGFNGRGLNTFAGAAGDGYSHGYPRIYVKHVYIGQCGTTPFCNSGVTLFVDDVFLENPGCGNEQMTVDNGCQNSQFSNICAIHNGGGGAGAISIDEGRFLEFNNITVFTNTTLSAIRLNCASGNVDNSIINNLLVSGGSYGVSIGSSTHDAQLILSNYRGVNLTVKDFQVIGNGVFIVNGAYCGKTTQDDFDSFPGTKTIAGSILPT